MSDDGLDRHEVTYREARAVLEAQRETLSAVDTKAVRTVRITVVLIGALVSAWRIDSQLFDSVAVAIAGLALVVSVATGLFTYNESDLYLGPNEKYIKQLADGDFDETGWRNDLLYSFGNWIEDNEREIHVCSRLLFASQTSLLCGIAFVGLSVLL